MKAIIIIEKDGVKEPWKSLKQLFCCKFQGKGYHYCKGKKFPFEYNGWVIDKLVMLPEK